MVDNNILSHHVRACSGGVTKKRLTLNTNDTKKILFVRTVFSRSRLESILFFITKQLQSHTHIIKRKFLVYGQYL